MHHDELNLGFIDYNLHLLASIGGNFAILRDLYNFDEEVLLSSLNSLKDILFSMREEYLDKHSEQS